MTTQNNQPNWEKRFEKKQRNWYKLFNIGSYQLAFNEIKSFISQTLKEKENEWISELQKEIAKADKYQIEPLQRLMMKHIEKLAKEI